MITKAFRQGFFAASLLVGGCGALWAAELRGVGVSGSTAGSAEVTLDLHGAATGKVFTLAHPNRVVIDLKDTRKLTGLRAPAPAGAVSAVRFGPQPGGTLRVVVELTAPLASRSTWLALPGGRQLVLLIGDAPAAAGLRGAPAIRPAHAPQVEGERDVIVAVDAGHGGQDPGAIGHGGTREKDVTLAIARALAERIDGEPGMRAVLTRDRDEFIELRERIRRARVAHADIFISVHADSIADRSVSGASVYVLSVHGASSEAARVLAEQQNAADLMGGVPLEGDLATVLLDATQNEIIGVSASAAERVVNALEGVGEVRKPQVQRAGFVVLKSPAIPSMLVETAYISNPSEERRLRSASQQTRLADAIATGVRSYFVLNPPDGTRFKQERRSTLASAADASAAASH
ncbi:MAG TPA: N-acetylmuramoyl-L-alanine amidase [Steroidobacteraceae bacterium]|jgi:N-acetylmuramoyl-L-alanine amidase|nr:N-acetylmuramoyl-L-alanine amidase [Steroidobacteraceae bacterium]